MEFDFKDNVIRFRKELSNLDLFVRDFIDILNKTNLNYVIVSGYYLNSLWTKQEYRGC